MRATAPCTLRLTDAHCGCRTSDVLTRVHFKMIKGARLATTSRSHRPQALPACHRRKARSSCTTNSGFASMAREMFQTDGLQLQLEQRQICVRTHTHTYLPAYTYTSTYPYSMYVCMHVCMYLCMYVPMYLCTYVFMYICIYASMYLCVYMMQGCRTPPPPHPMVSPPCRSSG